MYAGSDPKTAITAARAADVCIVVGATDSMESKDRTNLSLNGDNDQLIAVVAKTNPHTVAVVRGPGAVVMPWIDLVGSALFVGLAGQEAGSALASVLFGEVNPGGKLTLSFPKTMNDTWLSVYPGGPVNPEQYPVCSLKDTER